MAIEPAKAIEPEQPVFTAPWQAQAFALVVKLAEQGHFTWGEWTKALANNIQRATYDSSTAKAAPLPTHPTDVGEATTLYYTQWLATLEQLVTEKGLCDAAALSRRKGAWAEAYRHTPHGKPVRLEPDSA